MSLFFSFLCPCLCLCFNLYLAKNILSNTRVSPRVGRQSRWNKMHVGVARGGGRLNKIMMIFFWRLPWPWLEGTKSSPGRGTSGWSSPCKRSQCGSWRRPDVVMIMMIIRFMFFWPRQCQVQRWFLWSAPFAPSQRSGCSSRRQSSGPRCKCSLCYYN